MPGFSCGMQNTVYGKRGLENSDYFTPHLEGSQIFKLTTENTKLKRLENEKDYRLNKIERTLARVQTQNETLKQQTEKQVHICEENEHRRWQIYKLEREKSELQRQLQEKENSVRESRQQEQKFKKEKLELEEKLQEKNKSLREIRQQEQKLKKEKTELERKLLEKDKSVRDNSHHVEQLEIRNLQLELALQEWEKRNNPSEINQPSCKNCRNNSDEISKLEREVRDLRDRCKHKEELIEKSEKNTRQLEETIKHLKSDKASYQNDIEKNKNQATLLNKEMRLLEEKIRLQQLLKSKDEELKIHGKKMLSLHTEHKSLTDKWTRTKELLEISEKNAHQSREEIIHLKSDNVRYKNENEMLKNQTTTLNKEMELLEEKIRQKPSDILFDPQSCQNCRKCRNEIFDLKTELSRCKHAAELLDNSEKKTRQLHDEINHLKSDNAIYQKDTEKLKNQAMQLKSEIQLLEGNLRQRPSEILLDSQSCHNCTDYRKEISDLKAEVINLRQSQASSVLFRDPRNCQNCWKYRNEISDLKVEVHKLRDRLSEAAGNKLRDGNPNIADLSDMNRPTSLAEKFSSLYTDEYTDAMEVIEGTMDEQASVLFLLQLLQRCYDWSRKLAEEQRHLLSVESFGFMTKYLKQPSDFQLPDSCLIYVKEFQKKISADGNNLGAVEMICLEDGMKQTNLKSNQNMKKYMKKCSLLCWMMQISDPPIYLNFDVKVGEKLDKNVYNVFTKSGSEIEFLVWPAMYIHRTGPMLAKGVAQGK